MSRDPVPDTSMDPITAIGLASSLFTFVDLATKIIAGTYEVYNSVTGTTIENAHIDIVINDLKKTAADLGADFPHKSKHEKALKELATKCQTAADELLQLLNTIRICGKRSAWKSFKTTFVSIRKQKQILGLEKRLSSYRSQIMLHLNLSLQ